MSHAEPLFKRLNLLKVDDILTLQELTFYLEYNEGTSPVYLQNWKFVMNVNVHNYNTRKTRTLHTFKTKHEFAKKSFKYNIPHTINYPPQIDIEKALTHSMYGFSFYVKKSISFINTTITALFENVTYVVYVIVIKSYLQCTQRTHVWGQLNILVLVLVQRCNKNEPNKPIY